MSHGQEKYSKEDIQKIVNAEQFSVPKIVHTGLYLLIGVGILSFISEYIASDEGKKHAWAALHVNFMYWFGFSAAASGFAAAFHICNAQWVRPLRRIFEASFPFFVISPIFLLVMYFGAEHIYVWAREPIPGKSGWLQAPFLYVRDFFAAYLLVWIISRVIKGSLSLDMISLKSGLLGSHGSENLKKWSDGVFTKCCGVACQNNQSARETLQKVYDKMGFFSPICVMIFALSMSLLAFDILMSIDPYWYSTMFGGFYFMSSVYLAVAFVSISVSIALSRSELFRGAIKKKTLHDLGKLLFGFGIFWAYLFWSHYLPIWYGNMPEETAYIILRLREYPWRVVAWVILGMCFIVPFIMGISRDVKQIPILLSLTGVIVAIGLWMQYYLLFAPSLYPDRISINLHDVGVGLGFLGLYGICFIKYLSSVPLIPYGDLLIEED